MRYKSFTFKPPAENVWGETDKSYTLPGHRAAAKMLATRLIEQGFDTAYSYKPLHHPLGHAFSNAVFFLDYDRTGFAYPIVPFAINCYGRKVVSQRGGVPVFDGERAGAEPDPPSPTPWRLFDLGAATARILAEVTVSGRAAGILRLVARVSDREEPLSVSGHASRPPDVRASARWAV